MKLADRKKIGKVKDLRQAKIGSRRGTGPTPRLLAEKERDLTIIAKEMLKGTSYVRIADLMKEGRNYPVSKDTVFRDAKIILERWRIMAAESIDEAKAKQLAKLSEMEIRALEALERLENGTEDVTTAATTTKPGTGKDAAPVKQTVTRRNGQADTTSAWLKVWQFCMAERSRILGLHAAVKINAEGTAPITIGNSVAMVVNITGGDAAATKYEFPVYELPDDDAGTEPA